MEAELATAVEERLGLQRKASDLEAQIESLKFTSAKEKQSELPLLHNPAAPACSGCTRQQLGERRH